MTVSELMARLSAYDQTQIVPFGIGKPFSWRGHYREIAFPVVRDISVAQMLANVRGAIGKHFKGYKGGDYICTLDAECYVAKDYSEYRGDVEDELTPSLLEWMIRCAEVRND